ncbi:MAG: glycosyltransferase [Phycisphaerae bacterium]|nr:glycosyltransferase [Phycisphaerae bacterium]MDD5381911.1 glycosyltransferase [Phycisphaerae bacterium]
MLRLEDFRHLVPDETLAEIYARAKRLYGKNIVHLNATYQGGGVAEILYSLVLLMNDVGINAGWRILHGSQEFFEITKSFHNALQGAPLNLSEKKKQIYLRVNENFSKFTHLDHDCVIIHDPQPLSLIRSYRKRQPWIWRCHIDLTSPHEQLWDFLKGFLLKYDQVVFSSEKYLKKDLPIDQRLMFPAINPLSQKNRDITEKTILEHITAAGIPTDKPIITQVSRLDPWKDPEGVIDVFNLVKEKVDCRLLFCYNVASDDPEGLGMYNKVRRKANKSPKKDDILFVVGNNETLVNAIQNYSNVMIQKSTREGFCLAVTEALWKKTPVVASNVGGIPMQIENGKNGFLLEPKDTKGFADRIVHLLKNPKEKENLGRQGRETVREKFLITRLLSDYLYMLNSLIGE